MRVKVGRGWKVTWTGAREALVATVTGSFECALVAAVAVDGLDVGDGVGTDGGDAGAIDAEALTATLDAATDRGGVVNVETLSRAAGDEVRLTSAAPPPTIHKHPAAPASIARLGFLIGLPSAV